MALQDSGPSLVALSPVRLSGHCRALFAFHVGRSIDLGAALPVSWESRLLEVDEVLVVPPVRLSWPVQHWALGERAAETVVEVAVYAHGSVCVTWTLPFDSTLEELIELSAALQDNTDLLTRSRTIATEVANGLGARVEQLQVSDVVEDYFVFEALPPTCGAEALLREHPEELARVLRAETGPLSDQQIEDALARPVSYASDDVCLVDWLTALLTGDRTEEERLVLEFATVQLHQLRLLDARLDEGIEDAYAMLARPRRRLDALTLQGRELEHLARIQADDALVHVGIDNAIKLFGDSYFARVYRESGARLRFPEWGASIQRKLGVLSSIYESLTGLAAQRRGEALEWIIIVLIAIDILIYMIPR